MPLLFHFEAFIRAQVAHLKQFESDLVRVSVGKLRGPAVVRVTAGMGDCHSLRGLIGEYMDVRVSISELPWITFGQL